MFVLPTTASDARTARGWWFRACARAPSTTPGTAAADTTCSGWRSINAPDVWWAQGDASSSGKAVATAGGWLRVYGRSIGVSSNDGIATTRTGSTGGVGAEGGATTCAAASPGTDFPAHLNATLTPTSSAAAAAAATISIVLQASCYDAYAAIPATATPGAYTLHLENGLGSSATDVIVEIVAPYKWPAISLYPSNHFVLARTPTHTTTTTTTTTTLGVSHFVLTFTCCAAWSRGWLFCAAHPAH